MDLRTLMRWALVWLGIIALQGCVESVDAEYNYQDNLIFVDAYALTDPGTSSVTISRSSYDEISYLVRPIANAEVHIEEVNTGEKVAFPEKSEGYYECPPDFAVTEGEEWKLYISLEDGRKFESEPERVSAAIPIDGIKANYSPEVTFYEPRDKFVPGHQVTIDWQDPAGEENYYLWKYKTFSPLYVCKTCERGILRNGECQPLNVRFGPPYYSYLCDPTCWSIKFEDEPIIFEDRLSDGATIKDHEITILPFFRRPDILIEVQQLSLNKSAYDYFKIIYDQVNASGGLNAPPAAPLLGNLFNPENPEEIVLGNFTTAGASSIYIFIDRSTILETPFRPDDRIILEDCVSCPTSYPCEETQTRTSVKPEGWR